MSFSADRDVAKILYNLGHSMIQDDRGDLGWTTYHGRRMHHYGGRHAPHHSQPLHHWMAGTVLCLVAQAMALVSTAQDAQDVVAQIESELSQSEPEFDVAASQSDYENPQ